MHKTSRFFRLGWECPQLMPMVSAASLGHQVAALFESGIAEGINSVETFPEEDDLPRGAAEIHVRLTDIACGD